MPSIGIVGSGISALHLALRLRQFGIDCTLYSPHTPADLRTSPPLNFVTRFASTRDRERDLGITEWLSPEFDNPAMHMRVEAEGGPAFHGALPRPASSVDFRMYLADLLETAARRGIPVIQCRPSVREDFDDLAHHHDLVVVAAGRGEHLNSMFPVDGSRSPFSSPPRALIGGLFHGVRSPAPPGMTMSMIPGVGEIHAPTYHSFDGKVTALLIEGVPGGPFDAVTRAPIDEGPDAVAERMLAVISEWAPSLRERIDVSRFRLTRSIDVMQGALVPRVRRGWVELAGRRCALAIGDAWIVNDPLTAQGANLGSKQAFVVADAIAGHEDEFGEVFCAELSEALWTIAQPVVDWTNMFLGEPAPQVLRLLTAASGDQRVADAFIGNLDAPDQMWSSIRDSDATDQFIDQAVSARSAV